MYICKVFNGWVIYVEIEMLIFMMVFEIKLDGWMDGWIVKNLR